MIKECPVIINNDAVTVVRFEDTDVQFPSIHKDVKKVNVKYDNGKYSIAYQEVKAEPVKETTKETASVNTDNKKSKKTIKKKYDVVVDE